MADNLHRVARFASFVWWSGLFRQCKYPKEKAKKQMKKLLEFRVICKGLYISNLQICVLKWLQNDENFLKV
jgi:hypothetical protein